MSSGCTQTVLSGIRELKRQAEEALPAGVHSHHYRFDDMMDALAEEIKLAVGIVGNSIPLTDWQRIIGEAVKEAEPVSEEDLGRIFSASLAGQIISHLMRKLFMLDGRDTELRDYFRFPVNKSGIMPELGDDDRAIPKNYGVAYNNAVIRCAVSTGVNSMKVRRDAASAEEKKMMSFIDPLVDSCDTAEAFYARKAFEFIEGVTYHGLDSDFLDQMACLAHMSELYESAMLGENLPDQIVAIVTSTVLVLWEGFKESYKSEPPEDWNNPDRLTYMMIRIAAEQVGVLMVKWVRSNPPVDFAGIFRYEKIWRKPARMSSATLVWGLLSNFELDARHDDYITDYWFHHVSTYVRDRTALPPGLSLGMVVDVTIYQAGNFNKKVRRHFSLMGYLRQYQMRQFLEEYPPGGDAEADEAGLLHVIRAEPGQFGMWTILSTRPDLRFVQTLIPALYLNGGLYIGDCWQSDTHETDLRYLGFMAQLDQMTQDKKFRFNLYGEPDDSIPARTWTASEPPVFSGLKKLP